MQTSFGSLRRTISALPLMGTSKGSLYQRDECGSRVSEGVTLPFRTLDDLKLLGVVFAGQANCVSREGRRGCLEVRVIVTIWAMLPY